jgi:hypothetical protein
MTSPTFIAEFADGVRTRMTCHCTSDHLDLARGVKLSRAAYESRMGKTPPAIVKACFAKPFSDQTIKSYGRTELEAERSDRKAVAPAADVSVSALDEWATAHDHAGRQTLSSWTR